MSRFAFFPFHLALCGLLLVPSALAQTQIGGITLTPAKPPVSAPAASPKNTTPGNDYDAASIPRGYREVRGRVTGPSEGLRLPAGSQILVSLVDLNTAKSLVDVKFSTTRLSTPYQMVYNPVRLNAGHKYAVRAVIVDKTSKVLYYSSDTALPDDTRVTVNVPVKAP